jgi:putative hydrolase of the HAD superfamily
MVATRESEGESIERDREVLGNPDTGIRAVLFDFGGVLSTSPFEAFARYEVERGLPEGFLRGLNATDHHANAWARLERGEVTLDQFAALFEDEARLAFTFPCRHHGWTLGRRDSLPRLVELLD